MLSQQDNGQLEAKLPTRRSTDLAALLAHGNRKEVSEEVCATAGEVEDFSWLVEKLTTMCKEDCDQDRTRDLAKLAKLASELLQRPQPKLSPHEQLYPGKAVNNFPQTPISADPKKIDLSTGFEDLDVFQSPEKGRPIVDRDFVMQQLARNGTCHWQGAERNEQFGEKGTPKGDDKSTLVFVTNSSATTAGPISPFIEPLDAPSGSGHEEFLCNFDRYTHLSEKWNQQHNLFGSLPEALKQLELVDLGTAPPKRDAFESAQLLQSGARCYPTGDGKAPQHNSLADEYQFPLDEALPSARTILGAQLKRDAPVQIKAVDPLASMEVAAGMQLARPVLLQSAPAQPEGRLGGNVLAQQPLLPPDHSAMQPLSSLRPVEGAIETVQEAEDRMQDILYKTYMSNQLMPPTTPEELNKLMPPMTPEELRRKIIKDVHPKFLWLLAPMHLKMKGVCVWISYVPPEIDVPELHRLGSMLVGRGRSWRALESPKPNEGILQFDGLESALTFICNVKVGQICTADPSVCPFLWPDPSGMPIGLGIINMPQDTELIENMVARIAGKMTHTIGDVDSLKFLLRHPEVVPKMKQGQLNLYWCSSCKIYFNKSRKTVSHCMGVCHEQGCEHMFRHLDAFLRILHPELCTKISHDKNWKSSGPRIAH